MRTDKFTQKAQEAILEAQNLAQEFNHPTVDPEHILRVLIEQEGGVVPGVIARIGTDPSQIIQSVDRALAAKSRTSGGGLQIGMSRESTALLEEAQAIRPSSAEADRSTRDRQKPTNPRQGTVSQIRDGSGAAVGWLFFWGAADSGWGKARSGVGVGRISGAKWLDGPG